MYPLLPVSLFCFLPLALMLGEDSPLDCVPRKTVPYHTNNSKLFREDGVWNYSIMLLREDLGLLLLGAREVVYALDLNNISNKNASVKWEVTVPQQEGCKNKGKNPEIECKNYIRILHTMEDGRMYVCGTNAFDPECDYMSYADGELTLENKREDGKGKCPFDPFQRYSSIMVGKDLYSATSMNFLGSEPVVMRSSSVSIRTEFKSTWLNEPNFISMAQMPESEDDDRGDDDKVYLFFSEIAVEYDFYSKLVVSCVARVCKGDLGGQRTLQKKWTSFLKARMDCPVLESQLPYVIQDTYRWCEPQQHWRSCLFYAVFTPQSDTSDLSAVCAYRVADISRVFSEGKYKTPVTVETSFVKWVMYSGDVPSPRPGACIDNEARKQGITRTLDLPDRTLQFIRDRPLMDQAVKPVGDRPLLVRRGATFTRIIVDQVQAADGRKYKVMFIGTEKGTLLKAVNYDGEMFIIEEVEILQSQEPIKILRFSNSTRQIYAGSENGAVQVPLATCGRCLSCMDCVLARDPYCGWDEVDAKCVALASAERELIQSVKHGNASLCPDADPVKPVTQSIWPNSHLKLRCLPLSNLAQPSWLRDGSSLPPSARFQLLRDGLLILNASASDAGRYRCLSLERSHNNLYATSVAEYQVGIASGKGGDSGQRPSPQAQDGPSLTGLQATVGLLVVLLAVLLSWNIYKGHLPLTRVCRPKKGAERAEKLEQAPGYGSSVTQQEAQKPALAEGKPLVSELGNSSHNNHTGGEVEFSAEVEENASPKLTLQYIKDESEI
ncbi:semaphorin-4E [Lampris incognitus]|uniref:semaphorin-4E n=1 Tax=Lampris incognitus TaxID=2546036 RepID=UPI0024B48FE6|nr:semaphorin-4E [Lampris incognitus]XP_056148784.1 semaphorin-4E [Lampris incognitus]